MGTAVPDETAGGLDPSERALVVRQPALEWAREFVVQAVIAPGADALGGRAGREADILRRAAGLLERIGWPGSGGNEVTLRPADAGLIRLAAYAVMRSGAQDIEEGVSRDEPDAVDAVRRAVGLLDEMGWRGDDPPVENGGGWRTHAIDDAERMLASGSDALVVTEGGRVVHAWIPWSPEGDLTGRRVPHPEWPAETACENLTALFGDELTERIRVRAVRALPGGPTAVLLRDEAGRARLRDALVRGGERFRAIVDAAPVSLTFIDAGGGVVWTNETTLRWMDTDLPTFQEDPLVVVHPDDRQRLVDAMDAAMAEERSLEIEYRTLWDGAIGYAVSIGNPLFGIDGAYLGHVLVGYDLSRRRELERDLAYEIAIKAACTHVSDQAFIITDETGVITAATAGFRELTGFPEERLVGAGIPHPFWSDDLVRQHSALMEREEPATMPDAAVETWVRRPDGRLVAVTVTTRAAMIGERVVGYVTAMAPRSDTA